MATFFMFGTYSVEALDDISPGRTVKAVELLKGLGGEVKDMYTLLGETDLILIVELPSAEAAMKASVALGAETGIGFSTAQAISIEAFDRLIA